MSGLRAIGLVSGGLDSTLAARLMLNQGIDVLGVNFNTGFCISDTRRQVGMGKNDSSPPRHEALRAGSDLNIPIEIVDVSSEYRQIVTNPRWGYGKNANPCIDCRIMMLRHAKAMMNQFDAKFVFTGEVLGQRPMTQHRATLRQIEKQSDLLGFLLRPLSAQRLPETEIEKQGWVDRAALKGIAGRSRKPQIQLAAEMGVRDFPQPAGGCCFLTDPSFARKFFDFLQFRGGDNPIEAEDFTLLKVGRHLRLPQGKKLVLGRNEAENNFLENLTLRYWTLRPLSVVGPLGLLDARADAEDLEIAAQILARYSDGREADSVEILCELNDRNQVMHVRPFDPAKTAELLIF